MAIFRLSICDITAVWFILLNNTSFFAVKHNINEKITGKWQNHSFISNKYVSQSLYLNVTNSKNGLWKTVRLTRFEKALLQSLLIFFKLVLPCLVLYMLFTQFGDSFHCLKFDNSHDTAPLGWQTTQWGKKNKRLQGVFIPCDRFAQRAHKVLKILFDSSVAAISGVSIFISIRGESGRLLCSGELIMRFLIEPWRTVICSLYICTLYYLIETCDRLNTLLQTFFKSQLSLEKPTIPSLEEGELFHFLDNFISEDRKSERTYQNSDSSGIQGTSNL